MLNDIDIGTDVIELFELAQNLVCQICNCPSNLIDTVSERKYVLVSVLTISCGSSAACYSLNNCRGFKEKSFEDRMKFLREHNICFKCFNSDQHKSKDCKDKVPCEACGSESHASAIHLGFIEHKSRVNHGEEKNNQNIGYGKNVQNYANNNFQENQVQVKIHKSDSPNKTLTSYAILDDQSNKTLVYSSVRDTLGVITTSGRQTDGLATSLDGTRTRESLQTGGTHTGENIANALKEVKEKWSLPDIIAVTDDAANEKNAFQILNWIRFGRYGHRINHVVKNALSVSKEISHVIATGRKLVTFYHQSTSANNILMAKQKLLLQEELVMSQLLQCSGIDKNRHTKKPSKQKGEIYLYNEDINDWLTDVIYVGRGH
ncbi:unnamed protein product [Mytilus edulis]|uniref:Uncharacterized protein n=1 Tax=Mytilus edulis TaxID=6550 RepID=A0A8S3RYG6_MYTED|nr:unnamed protein product [Mytilus edulis]